MAAKRTRTKTSERARKVEEWRGKVEAQHQSTKSVKRTAKLDALESLRDKLEAQCRELRTRRRSLTTDNKRLAETNKKLRDRFIELTMADIAGTKSSSGPGAFEKLFDRIVGSVPDRQAAQCARVFMAFHAFNETLHENRDNLADAFRVMAKEVNADPPKLVVSILSKWLQGHPVSHEDKAALYGSLSRKD
jgi:regulator of replication initiation timing